MKQRTLSRGVRSIAAFGLLGALAVRRGAVAFTEADCKDKLCVRRGELTHVGDCMACVPMRVTVLLTGDGGADAVTG